MRKTAKRSRGRSRSEARNPIEHMLTPRRARLLGTPQELAGHRGRLRAAPARFFGYLRDERGLRPATSCTTSINSAPSRRYRRAGQALRDLRELAPAVLSEDSSRRATHLGRTSAARSLRGPASLSPLPCTVSSLIPRDLSACVESPRAYRLSTCRGRSAWDEVRRMLEAVDRRTAAGKRDYADPPAAGHVRAYAGRRSPR